MTTVKFITALFSQVGDQMPGIPKHPHATLWPSELVTLGSLHVLKGVDSRAFYRLLTQEYRALFSRLPERTRFFRPLQDPSGVDRDLLGFPDGAWEHRHVWDEVIHPGHEGRSPRQIGRTGLSNHRRIVGGKLCLLLNQYGLVVAWNCAAANVPDKTFQWLIRQFDGRMIVLSDMVFH